MQFDKVDVLCSEGILHTFTGSLSLFFLARMFNYLYKSQLTNHIAVAQLIETHQHGEDGLLSLKIASD